VKLPRLRRGQPSVHDGILGHYRAFWGGERVDELHYTPEHLGTRLPDFHVARVRPERPGGMWILASIGAWRATAGENHGLEFAVAVESDTDAAMRHLAITAYYHAGPPENRLGVGHTVAIGEPWVEGSTLDSILVSLPYLWGPGLEHCQLPDRHIQVLWLIPIAQSERAFAAEHGAAALEQRFEDAQFNYLNPFRAAVV
jgi:hypothetical protein